MLSPHPGDAAPVDQAALALASARAAYETGDASLALDALRRLRAGFPDSPVVTDSFSLGIEIALSAGDEYLARYFLQKLLAAAPGSAASFRSSMLLAQHCYGTRSFLAALEYYGDAVQNAPPGAEGLRADLDIALLRSAELSLYHANDTAAARDYFRRIRGSDLSGADAQLYRTLRVRLVWDRITAADLGLGDSNVSSLRADGDDLWVGTWNGGIARYSVSSDRSDPFPAPAFTRAIEVADRRVWVGTAEGLAWYGKSTGRWGSVPDFQFPSARKVQAVKAAAGSLYAGTLGDGLFRLSADAWEEVSDGDLPGRFINCIAEDPRSGDLLIGTMSLGLIILEPSTGEMRSLSEIVPWFTSANVTTILPDGEGRVWIGTYGDGLSLWSRADGTVRRFSKASGEIGDDWILASCETARAVYFGSFGGGVSAFLKGTASWRRYGIADGLASLDVAAIAWRDPYVFFGTLGAAVNVYDEAADGAAP